jgi:hypothetical protein
MLVILKKEGEMLKRSPTYGAKPSVPKKKKKAFGDEDMLSAASVQSYVRGSKIYHKEHSRGTKKAPTLVPGWTKHLLPMVQS